MAGYSSPDDTVLGHFNGKIDSPRIFGRALSPEEIGRLARDASPEEIGDGLVASWDFSKDISSARVVDASSNGLHGTAVNMPARAIQATRY